MRLQKWMAQCGVASRRASEELIAQGRVRVNGAVVQNQGLQIDPLKDVVEVSGKRLEAPTAHRYYIYFKPAGLLTTNRDPQHRPTIFSELAELHGKVVPVGRLDKDTRGLLLLTNDGELQYRLTHPSWRVEKTYIATVQGAISDKALKALAKGVVLDDGLTAPAKVRLLARSRRRSRISLTIIEGRKRQVRRMLQRVGHPVIDLLRTEFAGLDLERVEEGQVRPLRASEVRRLKDLVDLQ